MRLEDLIRAISGHYFGYAPVHTCLPCGSHPPVSKPLTCPRDVTCARPHPHSLPFLLSLSGKLRYRFALFTQVATERLFFSFFLFMFSFFFWYMNCETTLFLPRLDLVVCASPWPCGDSGDEWANSTTGVWFWFACCGLLCLLYKKCLIGTTKRWVNLFIYGFFNLNPGPSLQSRFISLFCGF